MNKFVTSALALVVVGSAGYAATGGEDEWLETDSEINSLASSLTAQDSGMGWTALLRVTYTYADDDIATGGGDDISGLSFEDVRLAFWGEVGEYGWRVSADLVDKTSSNFQLLDAYAWWEFGEYFTAQVGQYKAPVLRSNVVHAENLLFINRTILGSAFDSWDLGAGATGYYEQFSWYANIQNGSNGQESDHRWVVRGQFDLNGGAGDYEGALGANDELNGTVGAFFLNDDTVGGNDTLIFGGDAWGTMGPISLGGEIAWLDDDYDLGQLTSDEDFGRLSSGIVFDGDSTPWSLTLGFLINEELEAAFRFEDTDNSDDLLAYSFGLNWYQSGHNAKWQANFVNFDADGGDDGQLIQVGLVVGASR